MTHLTPIIPFICALCITHSMSRRQISFWVAFHDANLYSQERDQAITQYSTLGAHYIIWVLQNALRTKYSYMFFAFPNLKNNNIVPLAR